MWDKQELKGKGGLRDYKHQKSLYCQKGKAMEVFSDLISNIQSQYIILSYNNEGIIPREHILKMLNAIGQVKEYTTHYRRFRTEKNHEKRQCRFCCFKNSTISINKFGNKFCFIVLLPLNGSRGF